MRSRTSLILVALALVLTSRLAAPEAAEEKRFDPERCFPLECMAYLHVPSGQKLLEALRNTTTGRILGDPDVRAALGQLPSMAREGLRTVSRAVIEATGRDPLELLGLLKNEVSVSVTGIDPVAKLSVLMAVELGDEREAILEVLTKLSSHLEAGRGGGPAVEPADQADPVKPFKLGNREVGQLVSGGDVPTIFHLVLGTHLVLATSRDVLGGVVEAHDGKPDTGDFALAANPRYEEAQEGLALDRPLIVGFLNLQSILGLVMTPMALSPDMAELLKAIQKSGITSITSVGFSLGVSDGDLEARALLTTGDGPRGLLAELLEAIRPPRDLSVPWDLVPRDAFLVGTEGLATGKALSAIDRFLREGLPPEVSVAVDQFSRRVLDRTGISIEDLFSLGWLEYFYFSNPLPAGGLIPDGLALVRTEEFAPYLALLVKALEAAGSEPLEVSGPTAGVTAARTITYLRCGPILTRLLESDSSPSGGGLLSGFFQPPMSLAYCEIEKGYTVLSGAPQPIWRYLAGRQGGRRETGENPLAGVFRDHSGGAAAVLVYQPGNFLLSAYNTLVTLVVSLGQVFDNFLTPYNVQLALLPPGEKFLSNSKPGFLRVDVGAEGVGLHTGGISEGGTLLLLVGALGAAWFLGLQATF